MELKTKVIAVVGPTASGKTDLAVEIARRFNGEVISADSRQVYTGLDIGTGKATKREMRGVPHHLLDVMNPKRTMSVVQYERLATRAIRDILKRGKVPIICGGTGLYIDAVLTSASFPAVPPNATLRRTLAKLSTTELFEKLSALDPERAENIDAKNPHRLVRAIEIATALGSVPSRTPATPRYDALTIGLTLPREKLGERIHARLLARMRRGMVAEVTRLRVEGISWKRLEALGLEYRFLAQFLQGKLQKDEMLRDLETAIRNYAKRQMVWFKRDKNIHWLAPNDTEKTLVTVDNFLNDRA
ncbi:MAG TPA: tRNA (adenosine(37)-N6)-dimethylallyltransferase MiaA [Candidatus Yonathbacteria bacterium]|nr:tRNA (adenosine(37)-N6)-dimethylallyltransferase MiaA [Candidatus Yonathbacteria bacterium]